MIDKNENFEKQLTFAACFNLGIFMMRMMNIDWTTMMKMATNTAKKAT